MNVERINLLMTLRGLGPGELAYLSGVGYDTIYKIRQNERPRTSAEILGKLAQALGCSVDYLLTLTDVPAPYGGGGYESVAALAGIVSGLSSGRRREITLIAEAMSRAEAEDRNRVQRNITVNRKMLAMVRDIGGEEALNELLTLLGEAIGLDSGRLIALLDTEEPKQVDQD